MKDPTADPENENPDNKEAEIIVVPQARVPLQILIAFHQERQHVLCFDFDPHSIRLEAKCSKGVMSLLGDGVLAAFCC